MAACSARRTARRNVLDRCLSAGRTATIRPKPCLPGRSEDGPKPAPRTHTALVPERRRCTTHLLQSLLVACPIEHTTGALQPDAGRSKVAWLHRHTKRTHRTRQRTRQQPVCTIAQQRKGNCLPTWPTAASGTLSSLCRVLCTIRSLYCCAIGLVPIFSLTRGTPRIFELQSQEALLVSAPGNEKRGNANQRRVCNPVSRAIPVNWMLTLPRKSEIRRLIPCNTVMEQVEACQHKRSLGWVKVASSLAVTEAIVVTFSSSAD